MVATGEAALAADIIGVLISWGKKLSAPKPEKVTKRIMKLVPSDLTEARISLLRFSSLLESISESLEMLIDASQVVLSDCRSGWPVRKIMLDLATCF